MNNLYITYIQNTVAANIGMIKYIFLFLCTYYTNLKVTNQKIRLNYTIIYKVTYILISSIICILARYGISYFLGLGCLIFLNSFISFRNNIWKGTGITVISVALNYIIYFISIIINFVLNKAISINNDYINLVFILSVHLLLLINFWKIKKFKYGMAFLQKNMKNEYVDILILNLSTIILFSIIIIVNADIELARNETVGIILFIIFMFGTIQKSLKLYYKQKLLIQDLTETKSDLEKSKQEIQKLEKENIELSKKNHSFNHKYKALEHKLKEELLKTETAEEISLKDQLDDLSKEIYVVPQNTDLSKTNIEKIDDMLKFMQSECDKHKITFNLQVIGNIYHMTNNFISQEELQILIADHIKDAIIAINHSDNINKSMLVKLGKIEDCYGLYIYDSGIEFEKETLENLGKKPITTHINEGGSGMGFMNTFDTLRRHNASLIIEELGKPCKENFTKIIKFRFDGKNEFKVISYRNQ